MGVKLVVEVLDHAPAGLTLVDRLLLVVIAEQANDATRECWPGWELIAQRMQWHGNKDGGKNAVSTALARMAERGVEVRVPLAKDGAGRPVYAVRGRRTTYRIPEFRVGPQPERVDESATQSERVAQDATQSGLGSADTMEWVAPTATQERVDESATLSPCGPALKTGMGGNPEGNGWQSGGEWVAPTATPSPQYPSKNPQEPKDKDRDDENALFAEDGLRVADTNTKTTDKRQRSKKPKIDKQNLPGFDEWYQAYPRKDSPARARQAYASALPKAGHDPAVLIAAAKLYAEQERHTERRFIKMPTTWLNGECWLSDYQPAGRDGFVNNANGRTGSRAAANNVYRNPENQDEYDEWTRRPSA